VINRLMFGVDTQSAESFLFPLSFCFGGRKVICRAANCGKIGDQFQTSCYFT
jgi:hypothetical protein